MEVRGQKWNATGGIDCEINHPVYGWIPFTARDDDPEAHGREIFAALVDDGNVAAYEPPSEAEVAARWRESAAITPTEFFIAAKRLGVLTGEEAIAAAQGIAPQLFIDMLAADPDTDPIEAQILFARMTVVERSHPLVLALVLAGLATDEQIDAAFGRGA